MKKFLMLLWARIRCNLYLLTQGMWKGESELRAYSREDGRLVLLASTKGKTIESKVSKIFWDDQR